MTDWVSTKMARQMLGVSATTIKRWANERKMPSMRTAGGHRRFKRSDIQRILGGQVTMSDSPALKEHWLDWLDWLEPDELQLAIEVAQRKRRNLLDAQPAARQSAKILTMLPKAAEAYRKQIERGLDDDPRAAAKARVILKDLLGPIQMCPGPDGSLWAQYHTRPAALIKRAVGASVELSGSGGRI